MNGEVYYTVYTGVCELSWSSGIVKSGSDMLESEFPSEHFKAPASFSFSVPPPWCSAYATG